MLPVRWEIQDIFSLQDRTNRVFRGWPLSVEADGQDFYGLPPVDVLETEDGLLVRAEVPGIKPEEIEVRVENGTLVLSGERKQDPRFTDKTSHRIEGRYGKFTRTFTLPTEVDASKVQATCRDGILEIQLPRAEESKPRRVTIQA